MSGERKTYDVTVAGRINDAQFHQARVLARFLATENSSVTTSSIALTETEWEEYVAEKRRELGPDAAKHRLSPLVFFNGSVYIGRTPELVTWLRDNFGIAGKANNVLYTRMANKAYKAYIDGHKHPHCYFDLSVGGAPAKRVVFELFSSVCPRTCENFRALCTGEKGTSASGVALSYAGTPIHRVVRGGWVQGGDIAGGHGDGGESIYGATFADETFDVKHSRAGILSMASAGAPHTNSSQFFVTLGPLPYMDGKRVAFGRVISGMRTVRAIAKLPAQNQRPTPEVTISGCGVFTGAVYGVPPAGVDESKLEEAKSNSEERVRTALYARIFNSVDKEGNNAADGEALSEALYDVGGALFARLFVEEGTAALEERVRAAASMTFEAFCASAEDVFAAVHRGGVKFAVKNPFASDARPTEEKKKFLDLRRPATKRQLLYRLFQKIDTSGDGKINRTELLTALRSDVVAEDFPKHVKELAAWVDASATDDKVSFDEFHTICSKALSLPGGR